MSTLVFYLAPTYHRYNTVLMSIELMIGLQNLIMYKSGSCYLCPELTLSILNPHTNQCLHQQHVSSLYIYIFFKKHAHLLSLSHLFCRQRPHPAVAVSSGAADRQVLPVLHQLDRRWLGVQAF